MAKRILVSTRKGLFELGRGRGGWVITTGGGRRIAGSGGLPARRHLVGHGGDSADRGAQPGRQFLLCLSPGTSPDLVSWHSKKQSSGVENPHRYQDLVGEQLH